MFTDRASAGTLLASKLTSYSGDVLILGLARGGVAVAAGVAAATKLPLDVLVIKKIASPYDPELGIGAVAPDDVFTVNWPLAHRVAADEHYVHAAISQQSSDISQKMQLYRKGKGPLKVKGKTVILVDDGAATGATMEAAVAWAKKKGAHNIVVAVPVAARQVIQKLTPEVDGVVVLEGPPTFDSVGKWYEKFEQVSDEVVIDLLKGTA